MSVYTHCRICDASCGLQAQTKDEGLVNLQPLSQDPVSGGFICDAARNSISSLRSSDRLSQPMKRENGILRPVSWELAFKEIGAQLSSVRKQGGAGAAGLYLGSGWITVIVIAQKNWLWIQLL